ncbi:MAG: tetratricopeptide repeat protein [Candidatus Methanomethylophilaceae archaeon]
MTDFTVGERLLLHLYRYRDLDQNEIYNIPWELTQDGIATTLRISRAHASIELKKLKGKDRVTEYQAHVKGGKVKRYVYYLNANGLAAAYEVQRKADEAGVDVKSLLDLKCQDPVAVFDSMTANDRYALGCACAFRVPVPLTILKEHESAVIPSDVSGMTVIPKDVRDRYLSAADPKEVKSWHLFAADQWLDNTTELKGFDYRFRDTERIYHLIMCGMKREACKKISLSRYDIQYMDDRELFDALMTLDDCPERYALDVMSLKCEMAINLREYKMAREVAERMTETVVLRGEADEESGEADGYAYLAEIYTLRGLKDDAERCISMIRDSDSAMARLKLADIFIDMGRYQDAADEIEGVDMIPRRNAHSVFRRFYVIAKLKMAVSRDADASVEGCGFMPEVPPSESDIAKAVSKAFSSSNDKEKAMLLAMAKSYGYENAFRECGSS